MGRKILFITTDQMRFDALGCNGGKIARTPSIDALAVEGVRYTRFHAQNVVCMPARSTMITGQYVSTHGVWMNGVPLPADAPSVAEHLKFEKGYKTALIGKAHFEPFLDFELKYFENRMATQGLTGPHRGFDRMELAVHGSNGVWHYPKWLRENYPSEAAMFYPVLNQSLVQNSFGGGDTGAVQVKHNPVPREHYHTDWIADRTIAYLDSLDSRVDWFVWMSFPDPHHPWDPPQSEIHRHPWRDLPVPSGYPGSHEAIEKILKGKPRHWHDWWSGKMVTNFEAPPEWIPSSLTTDQLCEIDALTHVKNELIDEACARVFDRIKKRGWWNDTDIIFTTDHGEFQGDFGLLFKGPYHVDSLMRLPAIWRPAPNAKVSPAIVDAPAGQVDLAPTFCAIAGVEPGEWMQGKPLPISGKQAASQKRERVFTEWDSEMNGVTISLRTVYRDGYVITSYGKSSLYDGSEGELYDLRDDPAQHVNRWDDPAYATRKRDLLAELKNAQPPVRPQRLARVASV